jgi:hypothetical protein
VDSVFSRCVPRPRLAAAFAGYASSFVSLAVCAGLTGAVSFLKQPIAERPSSVVTAVSSEPSPEPQPAGKAGATESFRTFEPQGTARYNAASANLKPALLATAVPVPRPSTWQTVITFEGDRETRSVGDDDRRELARALQRELQRAGCYNGSINGEWNLQSKQAMRVFLDGVNAVLPINEPDQTLLALVKGQVGTVCGNICPDGESFAENDRCLPKAAMAVGSIDNNSAAGSASHPSELATNNMPTDVAASSTPLSGAMMIGGPRSEPEKLSNAPPERTGPIENLFIHPLGGY